MNISNRFKYFKSAKFFSDITVRLFLRSDNCTHNIRENLWKRENGYLLDIVGFWTVRNSITNTIMELNYLRDCVIKFLTWWCNECFDLTISLRTRSPWNKTKVYAELDPINISTAVIFQIKCYDPPCIVNSKCKLTG